MVVLMKPPIFVRSLSEEEREALEAGLRSKDAFVLRRSQILLASSRGESPPKIARSLGCGSQTVRNVIHAFKKGGLGALEAGYSRPKRTRLLLHVSLATSISKHATQPCLAHLYAGLFTRVRRMGILRTSH